MSRIGFEEGDSEDVLGICGLVSVYKVNNKLKNPLGNGLIIFSTRTPSLSTSENFRTLILLATLAMVCTEGSPTTMIVWLPLLSPAS